MLWIPTGTSSGALGGGVSGKVQCSSPYYAPELIENFDNYRSLDGEKCDIYSLGVLVLQFLFDLSPTDMLHFENVPKREQNLRLMLERVQEEKLRRPLQKMLTTDPKARITLVQLSMLFKVI